VPLRTHSTNDSLGSIIYKRQQQQPRRREQLQQMTQVLRCMDNTGFAACIATNRNSLHPATSRIGTVPQLVYHGTDCPLPRYWQDNIFRIYSAKFVTEQFH
jgi:hypothetical protein